jgi:glutamate synthase domain-containing protein 2
MPVRAFLTDSIRYSTLLLCALGALLSLLWMALVGPGLGVTALFLLLAGLVGVGVYDLRQSRHAILRNYPILGHMRFALEFIRPEIRQYFIEGDVEARAILTRAALAWCTSAPRACPTTGPSARKLDVGAEGYEWINHSMQPTRIESHDFRIWIGGQPGVPRGGFALHQPYSASVFNISAMSFGALSANAILALNQGARMGGFAHDTGEGSISRYHREHGGDLIWEIGSGYFGCRNADGSFSPERFAEQARRPAGEDDRDQAQPGRQAGPRRRAARRQGHARNRRRARRPGGPGLHLAVGAQRLLDAGRADALRRAAARAVGRQAHRLQAVHRSPWEWFAIVKAMLETDITPDFIVVDGAEGGTGAAPIEFTDHMGTPLQEGLRLVQQHADRRQPAHRIKIGCAGKVINSFDMARMLALGADWCNSGAAS